MSHRRFLSFSFPSLLVLSVFLMVILGFTNCNPSDRPSASFAKESLLPPDQAGDADLIWTELWNLDESPELEALVLVRSGREEILASFQQQSDKSWKLDWKEVFSAREPSFFAYDNEKKEWNPQSKEPEHKDKEVPKPGWIVQKVQKVQFPGDNFSSLAVEFLSEEPPLGLFSVPNVYRKGKLVMDGLLLFKESEELRKKKKIEIGYNPSNKSIVIHPKQPSNKFEMVWNGWELVLDVSGQVVPARLGWESPNGLPNWEAGKETEVILHFKNRGGTAQVTFLSLSFPQGEKVTILSQIPQAKVFAKGESIYNRTLGRYAPAEVPLAEVARESWLRNGKFSLRLSITPASNQAPKILFRSVNRIRKEDILLPSSYHSISVERDQQGFDAYSWILDKESYSFPPPKNPPAPDTAPDAQINPKQ